MRAPLLQLALLLTGLGVIACSAPGVQTTPGTTVEGQIRAPIGALQPGNPQGATTAPVANATVYLLDGAGRIVHEVKAVATDAEGRFRLVNVPPGETFMVAAVVPGEGGKMVVMKSLVKAGDGPNQLEVDLGSTLATDAVARTGPQGIAQADPEAFKQAQAAIGGSVAPGKVPDLTQPGALDTWLKANPGAAALIAALEKSARMGASTTPTGQTSVPGSPGTGEVGPIAPGSGPRATPTPMNGPTPTPAPAATPTPAPGLPGNPVERGTIFIDSRHRYLPHTVALVKGGAVIFVNQDEKNEHRIEPLVPGQFTGTGGIAPKKVSTALTFDAPGEYEFRCELHPSSIGKIVVE